MINLKLYTTILGISAVLIMFSCNSGAAQNNAAGTKHPKLDSTVNVCYLAVVEKDSVVLNAHMKGDSVTGSLSFKMYEKDHSDGSFRGKMYGDTLRAIYNFVSEGMESVSEIAFLRKDSLLIQGYGPAKEVDGKFVFKDFSAVKFEGAALRKVGCR